MMAEAKVEEVKPKRKRKVKRVRKVPVESVVTVREESEPEVAEVVSVPYSPPVGKKGKKGKPPQPNCLCIRPEGITFEYEYWEKPVGHLNQCLNDGKNYHVQIQDKQTGNMKPMLFPDAAFYNPKELANIIGAEPWRRYFERRNELLEKIAPWAFVATLAILLLALLIFGPKV